MRISVIRILVVMLVLVGLAGNICAQDRVTVSTGADMFNRYVWRGLDIANTPSIQPAISVGYAGIEIGIWGAYTMSNEASDADEIDFWLSYTRGFDSGASLTLMVIDYYFPNAGPYFFNFNDHDAVAYNPVIDDTIPDPGAHTVELGLSLTGPESFPLTVSGYVNVYNEAGNNTYFQLDYPLALDETDLTLFCGVAGGSEENPDYYGTDELAAINVGVAAVRDVKVTEDFSLPLSVTFVINPKAELAYLVAGISL
jgi:hypothetical protein